MLPLWGSSFAMHTDWKRPYDDAVQERNPVRIPALCDLARRAIHDRMLELASANRAFTYESEKLNESLRQLFVLERSLRPTHKSTDLS